MLTFCPILKLLSATYVTVSPSPYAAVIVATPDTRPTVYFLIKLSYLYDVGQSKYIIWV